MHRTKKGQLILSDKPVQNHKTPRQRKGIFTVLGFYHFKGAFWEALFNQFSLPHLGELFSNRLF
ncbi:hypothetical protein COE15_07430 [Bacillus cereus]|nr:hypothetical protein CN288_06005 [Bacillus sp. AFS023182]PGY03101.1 hypothetical protein COE15_07430 [Bacillus cereus]